MNADVRALFNVSAATANRILATLTTEGKLVKYREGGHWAISMFDLFFFVGDTRYVLSK